MKYKFRIWSDDHGSMCDVVSLTWYEKGALPGSMGNDDRVAAGFFFVEEGETHWATTIVDSKNPLMQYTGKDDIHGIEVYEHDVVMGQSINDPLFVPMGVVARVGSTFTLVAEGFGEYDIDMMDLLVVGNTRENPEMLMQGYEDPRKEAFGWTDTDS